MGGGSGCDNDMALKLSCLFSMLNDEDDDDEEEEEDGGCYYYRCCCCHRLHRIRPVLSVPESESASDETDEIGAEFAVVALTPAAAVISTAAVAATVAVAAADVNSTVVSYSSSFVLVDPKTRVWS